MKSPKKSKEPPLPSQDESRRTNVLFEKLISEFRTFGEAQSIMRERLDRMEPDLHAVKEDVAVLKSAVQSHTQDIRALKEVVQEHTKVIQGNSQDIRSLKEVVHANTEATRGNTEAIHAVQADLKDINQRLEVVEAKVAS